MILCVYDYGCSLFVLPVLLFFHVVLCAPTFLLLLCCVHALRPSLRLIIVLVVPEDLEWLDRLLPMCLQITRSLRHLALLSMLITHYMLWFCAGFWAPGYNLVICIICTFLPIFLVRTSLFRGIYHGHLLVPFLQSGWMPRFACMW
jgi:hypothetical protein